jgi:hypothetical protein
MAEDEDDRFYGAADGWKEILGKYPTDLVQARSDLKVVKPLENHEELRRTYSDPQFVLFARRGISLPVVEMHQPAEEGQFP